MSESTESVVSDNPKRKYTRKSDKGLPPATTPVSLEQFKPAKILERAVRSPEAAMVHVEREGKREMRKMPPPEQRKLGGTYRVIHGRIVIPLPAESWLNADGTEKPFAEKTEFAVPGDIIELNDADAARMLDQDVIEPMNTMPSRVGRVFRAPPEQHERGPSA